MKNRVLISCILLSTLVLLLLPTASLANEYTEKLDYHIDKLVDGYGVSFIDLSEFQQTDGYREVKSKDILKQIENGQDVNLTDCRIVGELNLSTIKLKTIPNPRYQEISQEIYGEYGWVGRNDNESFVFFPSPPEIRKELKVVESNITICNCILEDDLDFSFSAFKKPISFALVSFNSNATFRGSYFNNSAHFGEVTYNDSDEDYFFRKVIFNDTADFAFTTFEDTVEFPHAIFNCSANFWDTTFNNNSDFFFAAINYASFGNVTFNDTARFSLAQLKNVFFDCTTFKSTANFRLATFRFSNFRNACFKDACFENSFFEDSMFFDDTSFKDTANFYNAYFNDTANFAAPKIAKNIISDGVNSQLFIKYYRGLGQYDDADVIYYNYRKYTQERKEWSDFSKWTDYINLITCGYGVRPFNAFLFGTIIIFLFSFIYMNPISLHKSRSKRLPLSFSRNVFLDNSSNKMTPIKLFLNDPGIVNSDKNKKASLLDLFYFSICRFTFMSYENWYPRDSFRIFAVMEGIIGWVTLGIFMATLTAVMIRV